MKKLINFLVLNLMLLSACVRDPGVNAPPVENSMDLTVEDARIFFEAQTERNLLGTRAGASLQQSNPFNPGDFTPMWDKAEPSRLHERASVDIPILPSYRFRALQSGFRHGRSEVCAMNISQKLVVVKDLTTGRLGSYILTLIPDSSCGAKDTDWCSRFLNSGGKGKFSGLAIYTESSLGLLIRVSQYHEGRKIKGVYIPGTCPGPDRDQKIRWVKALLGKIRIGKAATRVTRSWGEDDWWWDDDDWWNDVDDDVDDDWWEYNGKFTDIGGGWFEDDAGNLYYDTDGDGKPDSMSCDDAVITPDPEPDLEPDPWPEPEPVPEPEPDPEIWPEPEPEDPGGDACQNCGNYPCICNQTSTTPERLSSAAKKSVEIITAKYGAVTAYCNQGVREAFYAVFNKELPNLKANDLINYMNHSLEWGKLNVSMSEIQNLANQGHFIVASWVNPSGGSGHVALVVPGEMEWGTWCGERMALPIVMDTGAGCREESQKLSVSFGKNKHADVEFYIYK